MWVSWGYLLGGGSWVQMLSGTSDGRAVGWMERLSLLFVATVERRVC